MRAAVAVFASFAARLAGILVADVLENFERCRDKFQLLADLAADAQAIFRAAGTLLLFIRQIVRNLDTGQMRRQLTPAMLVMIDAAGLELLSRLSASAALASSDAGSTGASAQRPGRTEEAASDRRLAARAVEAAKNRGHLRLVPLRHRLDGLGSFAFDLHDGRIALTDHLLQQDRVIGKIENRRVAHDRRSDITSPRGVLVDNSKIRGIFQIFFVPGRQGRAIAQPDNSFTNSALEIASDSAPAAEAGN